MIIRALPQVRTRGSMKPIQAAPSCSHRRTPYPALANLIDAVILLTALSFIFSYFAHFMRKSKVSAQSFSTPGAASQGAVSGLEASHSSPSSASPDSKIPEHDL